MIRIDVVTPPAQEPIDLAEAKLHLRVINSDEDTLIESMIAAAREYVERIVGYALVTQGLRATLDGFPCVIELRGVGLTVTAVKYTGADGAEQTLAPSSYTVDTSGGGARITPAYGMQWPATRTGERASVRIEFTSGYAPNAVPKSLSAAIKLIVGDLFANREAVVTAQGVMVSIENPTVDALIFPHRIILP